MSKLFLMLSVFGVASFFFLYQRNRTKRSLSSFLYMVHLASYANDCYREFGSVGRKGGNQYYHWNTSYRFGLYSYSVFGKKDITKSDIVIFCLALFCDLSLVDFFIIQFFPFLPFLLSISWGLFPRLENRFLSLV